MLKKTILACVLLHLVVGTISPQNVDSTDIKSMRAYYKQYFNDGLYFVFILFYRIIFL
jgi:hypothetical protein